ncbi:MAG: GspH/FimT family pseudopilin [Gammaproteobacteria bacterium]|nr:GspH/FimT family pseudopilin [Gammaproteobacteria bacterium]
MKPLAVDMGMPNLERARGFNLTELMVALAVAGVLMGIAIPELAALAAGQRSSARINSVAAAIHTTRHLAVSHNRSMTLCSGQGPVCGGGDDWHEGMLVFADSDGNRRVDDGEYVGARLPGLNAGETIVWRSFGNRSFLRFRSSGISDWQAGNFQYCPADRDPRFARQLILNAQGRTRHATDSDGDGIREDARGRPLTC